MRQVPKYLIIGNGRVARHFCHYFNLQAIGYQQWSRHVDPKHTKLKTLVAGCNPILLLISDAAIESFIKNHPFLQEKTLIHFSGCLASNLAIGVHPLMSFSDELHSLDFYQQIPFIVEENSPIFADLLPGLINPSSVIPKDKKAFYHALCVLSGNFTTILWQKFFAELETTLKIPKHFAHAYLQQICRNLQTNDQTALTGPLMRNDRVTIAANLQALQEDPFQKVYEAICEAYSVSRGKK